MSGLIASIDQGTTSSRCILFEQDGSVRAVAQEEHRQILPRPGWVEHDPAEIRDRTAAVVREALRVAAGSADQLVAIGLTNQRETVVFWDRQTGEPLTNAIVWQDTRTRELCEELARDGGLDRFRALTGLPLATYFSAGKIRWMLDHVDAVRRAVRSGRAACGTIDSWLIWNLTGGPDGGRFVTDVTNASRTQLMNLATLDWEDELLAAFGIPREILPEISSSGHATAYGTSRDTGPFGREVPITGVVGDQQAALMGQCCFAAGEAKNTYGTGCFLLLNTGARPVVSNHGLLTTVAYQLEGQPAAYALEGSVAVAGSLMQWLRDGLGLFRSTDEIEALARSVEDAGGVYIVPAFSGLFAPYWRSDARGVIAGLTRFVTRGHIVRAALEAVCYQARDLVLAMEQDSGVRLESLRVDGGMVRNGLMMQIQADLLDVPVLRPVITETTALGAAFCAGLAVGLFDRPGAVRDVWQLDAEFRPAISAADREAGAAGWKKAVARSLDWVE